MTYEYTGLPTGYRMPNKCFRFRLLFPPAKLLFQGLASWQYSNQFPAPPPIPPPKKQVIPFRVFYLSLRCFLGPAEIKIPPIKKLVSGSQLKGSDN